MHWKNLFLGGVSTNGLGAVALLVLAGCVDTPIWSGMSTVPTSAQLAAVRTPLTSYVYFTRYEVYYDRARRQFTYQEGEGWVTRLVPPRGISPGLLMASPSVTMEFRDAPPEHHAAVVRLYPSDGRRTDAMMASVK